MVKRKVIVGRAPPYLGGVHTTDENQSLTVSLLDIVRTLKDQILLLPEFQRDFLWVSDQTHDPFDALSRVICIGTIIHGKPSLVMTLRGTDDRPRGEGVREQCVQEAARGRPRGTVEPDVVLQSTPLRLF